MNATCSLLDVMVRTQLRRYGALGQENLSEQHEGLTVGSSCSDITCRATCLYRDNDGDHHRLHNEKGHGHKGRAAASRGVYN